jgi:hypothetical protein
MLSKLLHLILAIHVLISSMGVMGFEHLCKLRGRSISFVVPPKSCCKKAAHQKGDHCAVSSTASIGRSGFFYRDTPCCADYSKFFKADIQGKLLKEVAVPTPAIEAILPVASLLFATRDILPHNQKILRFYLYKPPPLTEDIRVLIQSFLC